MAGTEYLDLQGLQAVWEKIKSLFVAKDGDKVLSDNNFTTEEKEKLALLQNYTLEAATENTLGGIKVGDRLQIDDNGRLSAAVPIWSIVADTPTTLQGYGITDGVTLTEFNAVKGKIDEDLATLQADEIPGTTQVPVRKVVDNPDSDIVGVQFMQNETVVRTDTYTFGDQTVTEVRTLPNNKTLTIVTNTDTLETTTTYTGV